jgi:glyoxylase-like metal-dependent hydrolase (beta-lactamase superfamily II)
MFALVCDSTNDAIIIDPSCHDNGEFELLEAHLRHKNVKHILLTHGHADHVAGLADAAKKWPGATIHLHPLEEENFKLAQAHGLNFGLKLPKLPPPTHEIADGDILRVGENIQLRFIHSPGHSPGHVAFVDDTKKNGSVIVGGDLLFRGSVGRTDFFNSSTEDLLASLRRLYEELDDESIVLSGHTTPTFLKIERHSNPFVASALNFPDEWYQEAKQRHDW